MYNCFSIVVRVVRGFSVFSKRARLGISYESIHDWLRDHLHKGILTVVCLSARPSGKEAKMV